MNAQDPETLPPDPRTTNVRGMTIFTTLGFLFLLGFDYYCKGQTFKWMIFYITPVLVLFFIGMLSYWTILLKLTRKEHKQKHWTERYKAKRLSLDYYYNHLPPSKQFWFRRWWRAERRFWWYMRLIAFLALLFLILTFVYMGLYGLGHLAALGVWTGAYFLMFAIRRGAWCHRTGLQWKDVKYIVEMRPMY